MRRRQLLGTLAAGAGAAAALPRRARGVGRAEAAVLPARRRRRGSRTARARCRRRRAGGRAAHRDAFLGVGSKLRITDMKVFGVTLDERIAQADRPYVFVKLETNQGVVGWGEATLEGKASRGDGLRR